MAANYLGQFPVNIADTCFAKYTDADWAMWYIVSYGSIDGAHHKTWLIDQVMRILNGTPIIVEEARWGPSERYPDGFAEYRIETGDPSEKYLAMVREACDGEDGPDTYEWEVGIAP